MQAPISRVCSTWHWAKLLAFAPSIDSHQARGGLYFASKVLVGLLPVWLGPWVRPLLVGSYFNDPVGQGSDKLLSEVLESLTDDLT